MRPREAEATSSFGNDSTEIYPLSASCVLSVLVMLAGATTMRDKGTP